jgi:hypothetical protein
MHFTTEEIQCRTTLAQRAQLYSVLAYMSRYYGLLEQ